MRHDAQLAKVMRDQLVANGHLADVEIDHAYSSMLSSGDGVRSFLLHDWESAWALAQKAHARSQYGEFQKMDKYACFKHVLRLQMNPDHGHAFVSVHQGEVRGFLVAIKGEYWWNPKHWYAAECAFCSTYPGHGKQLLEALEHWAFLDPRVKQLEMDVTSGIHPKSTARLYVECGFERRGFVFIKRRPRNG